MFRKCRFYIWSLEISCMLCKLIRKRHGVKDRHRKSLYKTPRKLPYPQIWDMSKSLNSKSWDLTFLITEEKSITMSLTNYKKHLKGWRILWQVSRWRQLFVIFQTSVKTTKLEISQWLMCIISGYSDTQYLVIMLRWYRTLSP